MHVVKLKPGTGTVVHNILHSACEQIGGAGFDDFCLLRCVVKEDIAVLIQNLGVEHRLDISSVIGDRRIGSGQFQIADTPCDTAQSGRLSDIRVHLSIHSHGVHNGGKAEFQQIFISKLRGYICDTFYCHNVDRINDGFPDGGRAAKAACQPVVYRFAVYIFIIFIVIDGCQCLAAFVQRRCISGNNLKSRTGLPYRSGCSVQR